MEDNFSKLKAAVINNDLETLRSLFRGKHGTLMRNRLWEIAHIAATQGHWGIFQCIVEVEPSVLEQENIDGETVAHIAAKSGHLDIVSYIAMRNPLLLLKNNNNGDTVALAAARNGQSEIVRFIVKQNPSALEMKDSHNNTLLHLLVEKDDDEKKTLRILKFLAKEESSKNITSAVCMCNDDGQTVVHVAAKYNNLRIIKYIVEREPSVLMKVNNLGETVAHVAAKNGYLDTIIRYLADTNPSILLKRDLLNNTYFNLAVMKEHMDERLLTSLVEDSDDEVGLTRGFTIAQLATTLGDSHALKYILDKNRAIFEESGGALAYTAAKCGKMFVLKEIICKKPVIFTQNVNILFELPDENDMIEAINEVEQICNTEVTNWDRQHFLSTVIDAAIRTGYLNVLKYFVERENIDVDKVIGRGESAVFTAVRYTHLHILKYLVEKRHANLTAMNSGNSNILYICVEESDIVTMKYVLDDRKAQIDINWRNKNGHTLLHTAVKKAVIWNEFEVLKYLVEEKHADINAFDTRRKTALHYVASHPNYKIFDYLIGHGANPKLEDENGSNFWDVTRSSPSRTQPARSRRNVHSSYFIDQQNVIQHTRSESGSVVRRNLFGSFSLLGGDKSISFISSYGFSHPLQNFLTITRLIFSNGGWKSFPFVNLSPTIVLLEKMDPIAVDAVSMTQSWEKGVALV